MGFIDGGWSGSFFPRSMENYPFSFQKVEIILNTYVLIEKYFKSIIEKYDHLEENFPNIHQRIPQYLIASYLGITPEALSKIRGEMLK